MSINTESIDFWKAYTRKKKLYGITDGWCVDFDATMKRISDELFAEFGVRP